MIKRLNSIIKSLIKPEVDLILENLMSDLQKQIFTLFYVQKIPKKDIQKMLNISKYSLENNLVIIREKIGKIPQFNCSFKCDDASEARLRERCRKLGKNKEYTEFCVLAFVKKYTKKQLAQHFYIDIETVRKYKSIRRKELEK